jgi:hypothetical protein
MKFTIATAAAVLASTAMAAHEKGTFAVLRFNGKELTKGRMDPSVSPGKPSKHVHSIMGASGFSMSATADDLLKSECSNAKVKGDFSNYWFPSLYFKDPNNGSYESVSISYVNAYYFFEQTNDDLKAFPLGLKMISGDPDKRDCPGTSKTILSTDEGEVQPIKWTCPRLNNNYDPPSWREGSDGSESGMGDPINKGEGVGFPDQHCDGLYSPLRADIHFPSCYNPDAGLDDIHKNMAWPKNTGSGNKDCPEGHIHVPHLFIEVYWDTPAFKDRWTPGSGPQPFVLSNGDATGYSSHADFFAGWEEDLLQHIIDTCDAGTEGMDKCPGLFHGLNEGECTIPSEIDEQVDGVMDGLPGGNVIQGWSYGMPDVPSQPTEPEQPEQPETPVETPVENPVENPQESEPEQPSEPEHPEAPIENPVEQPSAVEPPAEQPTEAPVENPVETCNAQVHTVYETVTVTAGEEAAPTAAPPSGNDEYNLKKARRSAHAHRHRRHH